jgi:Zn-dependent peptidase ImmA (M78 family)/DNA-binding XRE family transcriptional regulator
MPRVEALITASVLSWARKTAGMSVEEAAKKLGRPTTDIIAWEAGDKKPSIAQARKASEVFNRPLALFYLPEPPRDFYTLRDYRSLPFAHIGGYGVRLTRLIKNVQERQQWARDFLREEGVAPLKFVGSASCGDSAYDVGKQMLSVLKIDPDEQCSCGSRPEALRLWLRKTEEAGIFVFREGGIDLTECRGFLASDDIAPFIYLNSKDAKAAQMFTLVHELAHLWINQSGVSNLEQFGDYSSETDEVESFCNKVASEVLLSRTKFEIEWERLSHLRVIEDKIENLSRTFKVSEEVVARRLLNEKYISQARYVELREQYQRRWKELEPAEKNHAKTRKGGPSYYKVKVVCNGYAFTRTVIAAFYGGNILGREASALLGVKLNHFSKLADAAGFPLSA